jgi:hypothetical protein
LHAAKQSNAMPPLEEEFESEMSGGEEQEESILREQEEVLREETVRTQEKQRTFLEQKGIESNTESGMVPTMSWWLATGWVGQQAQGMAVFLKWEEREIVGTCTYQTTCLQIESLVSLVLVLRSCDCRELEKIKTNRKFKNPIRPPVDSS